MQYNVNNLGTRFLSTCYSNVWRIINTTLIFKRYCIYQLFLWTCMLLAVFQCYSKSSRKAGAKQSVIAQARLWIPIQACFLTFSEVALKTCKKLHSHFTPQFWYMYRSFRTFTRTADYPQRSIFAVRGKKVQQITRTGLLPPPQNQRKSCYCIIGITTHKLGAMNILCFCLQSRISIAFSAKNWLLIMQP